MTTTATDVREYRLLKASGKAFPTTIEAASIEDAVRKFRKLDTYGDADAALYLRRLQTKNSNNVWDSAA